jgi:hypothetical protein
MSLPDLEAKCWKCWGTGLSGVENHGEAIECPVCSGLGWVPTADGKRLLDFLERHLTLNLPEAEPSDPD